MRLSVYSRLEAMQLKRLANIANNANTGQSVNLVSQSVSQSVSQPVSQSASQSVSQRLVPCCKLLIVKGWGRGGGGVNDADKRSGGLPA